MGCNTTIRQHTRNAYREIKQVASFFIVHKTSKAMPKISPIPILACIVSLSLLLTGCDREEEVIPTTLVGTWTLENQSLRIFFENQEVPVDFLRILDIDEQQFKLPAATVFEFKEDGSYVALVPGEKLDMGNWVYEPSAKTLTLNYGSANAFIFQEVNLRGFNLDMQIVQEVTDEQRRRSSAITRSKLSISMVKSREI
jgi:hypothetical protein